MPTTTVNPTTTTTTTCTPDSIKVVNKILYKCYYGQWVQTDCEYDKFLVDIKAKEVKKINDQLQPIYTQMVDLQRYIIQTTPKGKDPLPVPQNQLNALVEQYKPLASQLKEAQKLLNDAISAYDNCISRNNPLVPHIINWLQESLDNPNSFFSILNEAMANRNASSLPSSAPNYGKPARGFFNKNE